MSPDSPQLAQILQLLATTFAGTLTFLTLANAARVLLKEYVDLLPWHIDDVIEELAHVSGFLLITLVVCGVGIFLVFVATLTSASTQPEARIIVNAGRILGVTLAGIAWLILLLVVGSIVRRYFEAKPMFTGFYHG